MDLSKKQWYLNIVFSIVILLGIALVFMDHKDSTMIIGTMIGIPLTAFAAEMGVYSHHIAKNYRKETDSKPKDKKKK